MATYIGTEGPDVYVGTPGNDLIIGLAGDDELHGGDGDDMIEGDEGDDTLYGDAGNDRLEGDAGDDVMFGGDGNDLLDDGEGNDTIDGGAGNDIVVVSFLDGFSALDHISGGTGIDKFDVTGYFNVLNFDLLNVADDFEVLFGWHVNLEISTERLSHFQSVTVDSVRLTTAGTVTFNASFAIPVITFSDLGNSLDLSAGGSSPYLVTGGAGNDIVHGGGGADDLSGGAGVDLVDGGAGDDILHVQQGEVSPAGDHYIGGSGTDTLFIDGPDDHVVADISAATVDGDIEILDGNPAGVRATRAQIAGFTTIALQAVYVADGGAFDLTGRSFSGTLYLSDAGNQVTLSKTALYVEVDGGAGADTIVGGDHGTIYRAGGGDDLVYGGSGGDFFYDGAGSDLYNGGGGSDNFFITAQTTGGDQFIGGAGTDFIQFVGTPVDLSTYNIGADIEGIAGTDLHLTVAQANRFTAIKSDVLTLTSAGTVILHNDSFMGRTLNLSDQGNSVDLSGGLRSYTINGGMGADTIIGANGGNFLNGGGGDDVMVGGAFDDRLDGGTGADAIYGEDGNDTLTGGTDFQTDIMVGGNGNDILHGDSGLGDVDQMDGGAGNDIFYVDAPDDLTFEAVGGGTDTVYANISSAGYYLSANVENLVLLGNTPSGVGNELDNHLTGSGTANSLFGGAGNDVLNGKTGNDELFGESGADIFVFESGTGKDLIRDFQTGIDKIDLTGFGLTSYADVQAHMLQNKHATYIDLGHGDIVVVQGVFNADFSQSDFII